MWDRKELKSRGRFALKKKYWCSVLVALLLTLAVAGGAGVSASSASKRAQDAAGGSIDFSQVQSVDDFVGALQDAGVELSAEDRAGLAQIGDALQSIQNDPDRDKIIAAVVGIIAAAIFGVVLIVCLISTLVDIFLFNPIEVGCQAFFANNSRGVGELGDLGRGFSPGYGRVVKTMFLRGLYVALWSLLFIIPGVIKSYSYRMVPYILADQPELGGNAAITRSREMMAGNKWKAFVLDLSFIGWELLSCLTLGVLGLFYVKPYRYCTNAELYQALKAQ